MSPLRIGVGLDVQQQLDDLLVAFCRSCMQRAAIISSLGIDIGSVIQQQLHDPKVTPYRSRLHRVAINPTLSISRQRRH
jgi:hypothetical protein